MAAPVYICWNGTSSALASPMGFVASAAAGTVKTMLQIKPGSSKIRIVEWGYMFNATPAGPVQMELIETGTVFATVTSGNVLSFNDTTGPVSLASTGTAATGYTATAEGSITASRLLDQTADGATFFKKQFPLGREPEVQNGYCLRVRATPSTGTVNIACYVAWEE